MKNEIYPHPRPTPKQITAAVSIATAQGIPIPPLDYMVANEVGKWIRTHSSDKKVLCRVITTIYSDGSVSTTTERK